VCIDACMYVCINVCISLYMYVCMYTTTNQIYNARKVTPKCESEVRDGMYACM